MTIRPPHKVVVMGSMCRLPVAGVVYQILHYMVGLERLGFEPYYVEWHGNWFEDPTVAPGDAHGGRVVVADVMERFGFGRRWSCRADHVKPGHTFGALDGEALKRLYADAAAVLNVTGAHFMEEDMLACPRRVYVETDPGIPQIRVDRGDPSMKRLLDGHTHLFTFAQNFGNQGCDLPATELDYRTTRQPVVLDLWREDKGDSGRAFTTIARWRKPKEKAVEFRGDTYRWNKDGEFLRFVDLPRLSRQPFELALSEIRADECTRLEQSGWRVIDAIGLSSSLDAYRRYIGGSRGEFTIAKDQYVRLNSGWFSDRSACYLAAGRPVVTEDTAFGCALPTGEGLFAFRTLDDALGALEEVERDYRRHADAAREIAREFFDADRVLRELMQSVGLECAPARVETR